MSRLFRDVGGGPLSSHRSVVCIGAFDGLHRGHQALVQSALDRARLLQAQSVVLSFEPLPREFFLGDKAPPRIAGFRSRVQMLSQLGIDWIGLLRFNQRLASMSAEQFVERVLVSRLRAAEVWVGEDFRFGKGRAGNPQLLAELGQQHGFDCRIFDRFELAGERVSSSRVRQALADGDLEHANHLLGHPYRLSGRVVRGQRLGRKLGFPTANIRLAGRRSALDGIVAAWVQGVGEAPWPAVCSIGTRPTVGGVEPLLEVHLFDFDGDLYGQRLTVDFVAKLRDEEKFPDLPSLVAQMERDAVQAREILNSLSLSIDV
ncbi:bifunctional riboflavin kinase/FAD synthetase [Pseudomarimonas arenosa]|uniref:Riboflavin biosynthesis protein n=1 Tax=Pseudomarimonas arenosa TaxID=2774145 RepID=A0AAW3ZNA5_9GAMM|nr:bifunctional riboflavin kinase/FAD synthetase [Pseudomarimonas arenosa]MBD8526562.1 bifunctional riboflavin kinase/FAD synthetase [Pseudomarimonas arenosa]